MVLGLSHFDRQQEGRQPLKINGKSIGLRKVILF